MPFERLQSIESTDESVLYQFLCVLLLRHQPHHDGKGFMAVTLQEIAEVLGMTVEDSGY